MTDPVDYKVVDQPWQPSDPAATEAMLNSAGAQGWNLDSVYPDRQREKTRWAFSQSQGSATPVSYKVVDQPWQPSDPAATQALLTPLGAQGWSLVIAYPDPQRERTRWIFSDAPAGGAGTPGPAGPAGPQGPVGPTGPTNVSTDPNNLAKLGTDHLLLVPSTFPLPLTIAPPSGAATLSLNKAASGATNAIRGSTNGIQRWELDLGNSLAESGTNKGSNFLLTAYDDTGVMLGNAMTVNRSSQVVTFPQTIVNGSDTRWKENATPIVSPLATIQALNAIRYTIVGDSTGAGHYGMVAQDVQSIVPEAVIDTGSQTLYGIDYDNALGVSYADVTAILVEAVKELAARVAAIVPGAVHYVRVLTNANTLNSSVANGGILQFDTTDKDTDGFAPATPGTPFTMLTIPPGLGGVYVINGWSSGSGTQSTTLGMGLRVNSTNLTGTNQAISGPSSVNYTLDNAAVAILQLNAGDTIELFNTSVSGAANAFTAVFMSLVRIEPGLMIAP